MRRSAAASAWPPRAPLATFFKSRWCVPGERAGGKKYEGITRTAHDTGHAFETAPFALPRSNSPPPRSQALDYLQSKRVVYRDLKLENLLLNSDADTVQLADFGLAKQLTKESPKTNTICGTIQYMGALTR